MSSDYFELCLRLAAALAIGGLIGMERSYHGRPAGFRTHTLVCMASSVLMLVTVYESDWFVSSGTARVAIDPTRMAQGIMTGIGFLGAGVIMKDGLSVRGLTTAASIWITAAIGILVGIGFYFPAGIAAALTLATLSVFRWIEAKMPSKFYAHHIIRFPGGAPMPEPELRNLLGDHGFSTANLSYRVSNEGNFFEYEMSLRADSAESARRLAATLSGMKSVLEFRISPSVD
jgi:putative Mg2+ transporter-C (MgtC) family protein